MAHSTYFQCLRASSLVARRIGSPVTASTLRMQPRFASGLGSNASDNNPAELAKGKKNSVTGMASTDHHFNKTDGWVEEVGSDSEAAVKADRSYHHDHDDLSRLQKQSTEAISKRKH